MNTQKISNWLQRKVEIPSRQLQQLRRPPTLNACKGRFEKTLEKEQGDNANATGNKTFDYRR